jgi:hypothetical protein
MNLAPSEVSPVLADPNGYVVDKVKSKSMVSLDQASRKSKEALRTQQMQHEMNTILNPATSALDNRYLVR